MTKLEFKSEKEMNDELNNHIKNWKDGQSRDGFIIKAQGIFNYRGISYEIKVLRYFNHTNKFTSHLNRISDCHCVVEYPDETKPLVELLQSIFDYNRFSEFLYHDTLHTYCDNMTVEEQINECHRLAKEDIDSLLNGDITKQIEDKIEILKDKRRELHTFILKKVTE